MEYFLFALSCTLSQKEKNQVDHLSVWKEQRQRECKESKKYPPPPPSHKKNILFFFPLAGVEKRPCDAQDIPNPPTHPSLFYFTLFNEHVPDSTYSVSRNSVQTLNMKLPDRLIQGCKILVHLYKV